MPELPELEVIRERLEARVSGRRPTRILHADPFVLRTHTPALESFVGVPVTRALRLGKSLALVFEGGAVLAFHLMLAGRLHLVDAARFRRHAKRTRLAIAFAGGDGDDGEVLELTEAGTKHRAWVRAGESLESLDLEPEGIDPMSPEFTAAALARVLRAENRRIKSALRDSTVVSGIGNAYSDEILFDARLSPMRLTSSLDDAEIARLAESIPALLRAWIERVRTACPTGLPASQKDWRREMAVHGRAGLPCPACGSTIAMISFRDHETNYCPTCQNEGKLLADRRLSRFGIRRAPRAPKPRE